jgi:hypothetical protein
VRRRRTARSWLLLVGRLFAVDLEAGKRRVLPSRALLSPNQIQAVRCGQRREQEPEYCTSDTEKRHHGSVFFCSSRHLILTSVHI